MLCSNALDAANNSLSNLALAFTALPYCQQTLINESTLNQHARSVEQRILPEVLHLVTQTDLQSPQDTAVLPQAL